MSPTERFSILKASAEAFCKRFISIFTHLANPDSTHITLLFWDAHTKHKNHSLDSLTGCSCSDSKIPDLASDWHPQTDGNTSMKLSDGLPGNCHYTPLEQKKLQRQVEVGKCAMNKAISHPKSSAASFNFGQFQWKKTCHRTFLFMHQCTKAHKKGMSTSLQPSGRTSSGRKLLRFWRKKTL